MNVLLVDDQRLLGDALQLLITTRYPEIVLDVAHGELQAFEAVVRRDYELVLLDWWLGSEDAERCFQRLRELAPAARIVIVSADDRQATVTRALELGAAGFLPKSVLATSELVDAMQIIARGGIYLPEQAAIGAAPGDRPRWIAASLEHCFPAMTARQRDVLRVLLRGCSDKQIARELDIALSTVKSHVQAVYRTLGVFSRAEAVVVAARLGARID